MNIYTERAHLLAALTHYKQAWLSIDPEGEEGFHTIVVFHPLTPGKQMAWHIADDDVPLFAHLAPSASEFDGHTTEEKYVRLSEQTKGFKPSMVRLW